MARAPAGSCPWEWLRIYLCNPIASILTEMRHVMMDPHAAGAAEAIGGAGSVADPARHHRVRLALSCFVIHREAPRVAKTCRAMATTDEIENTERAELEALRARVAALEAERAEEIARAHATVAAAQERLYWVDRLQLDLERWLGSPAVSALLSAVPCGSARGPRGCSCAVCAAGCAARCADRRLPSPLPPCRVPAPKR
ncbi:MAG TPA: hypothetical protein VFY47_05325 [Thermoleophilaceae bacterium]|nr:hypothetical protein [Thermoleophilaceae bacterium]